MLSLICDVMNRSVPFETTAATRRMANVRMYAKILAMLENASTVFLLASEPVRSSGGIVRKGSHGLISSGLRGFF